MNLRKLILAGAAGAALLGVPAQASIIDNPQFRVLGLVIVWGADSATGTTPVVSDFIINSDAGPGGTNDADLIGTDVHAVVTGTLTPVPTAGTGTTDFVDGAGNVLQSSTGLLDASDSFTAFDLTDTTDITVNGVQQSSSFFVASNTNFSISGDASLDPASTGFTLDDIGFEMSVGGTPGTAETVGALTYGGNAQDPQGTFPTVANLGAMPAGTLVYDGTAGRLTAATVGSIADQSVRFDAVYTLGGAAGYDLSLGAGDLTANIEYTVFVP